MILQTKRKFNLCLGDGIQGTNGGPGLRQELETWPSILNECVDGW